jgi:spore coat polysaccharide biosynthesis predicted glycosyltransferase SpsG
MTTKIIFWLDLFTLHFGTAYFLQKKIDCELFAIIDTTDRPKPFFQTQKLVDFKKFWFYHDNIKKIKSKSDIQYLHHIEKKYGLSLWQLAINERLFYQFNKFHKFDSNEILSILEQECKLFEKILDETKPDVVIIEQPALHQTNLFYLMCKSLGIKTLMINPSPLAFKSFISVNPNVIDSSETLDDIKSQGRTFDELRSYHNSLNFSDVMNDYATNFTSQKNQKIKAAIEYIFKSKNTNIKTHYTYYGRHKFKVIFESLVILLKRKYRKSFLDKNTQKNIDPLDSFIYFPLQVVPDRNSLIGAPYFTNQLEIIRHLAKSIPINYKLYVKEHPAQNQTWRKTSEYKQMMEIPNVKLIHPSVSVDQLYKNCSLLITTVGTSGFEATFYEKPVLTLADVSYSLLPSVTRVTELDKLPKYISNSINQKVLSEDLDKFLVFLEKNSIDFDLFKYFSAQTNYFFYNSNLIDVEISEKKNEIISRGIQLFF